MSSSVRSSTRQKTYDAVLNELFVAIKITTEALNNGKLSSAISGNRVSMLERIKSRFDEARQRLEDSDIEDKESSIDFQEEKVASLILDFFVILDRLEHLSSTKESAVTESISRKTSTKISMRPFEESCPSVWFRQLEIQLEAAAVTKDEEKFAHLQRFLDGPQSLAIAPTLDSSPGVRYQEAKELLLALFLPEKPTRVANIIGARRGE
ncbi:Hypothetical predicted protein, partial [Paramuricea clavata]